MKDQLLPERLRKSRIAKGLTMAEASRLLKLSKMGYNRYETGDRIPSYQTIQYLAEKLDTSYEYLCGLTDDPTPLKLHIHKTEQPELFTLALELEKESASMIKRVYEYYRRICSPDTN